MDEKHKKIINLMIKNRMARLAIMVPSHYWFFHFYFHKYIQYPTAEFQRELLNVTERQEIKNIVVAGFRDSGKSSIITMSYAIWAIIGRQQKKSIYLVGETEAKAKEHLGQIKKQFEENRLLQQDLGPFRAEPNQWAADTLVLPRYDARIIAKSIGQSIRGVKFGQYRPDVIIFDDAESTGSVKTREKRDSDYRWLMNDAFPAGDIYTRIFYIGTPLHPNSMLMRLKKLIEDKKLPGVVKWYPFFNEEGKPFWPGKFPNQEAVDDERKNRAPEDFTWNQEYLLRAWTEKDQIIKPEWIQTHEYDPDRPPHLRHDYKYSVVGVDLAISESDYADYTAMVILDVCGFGKDMIIYVRPNPICERIESSNVIPRLKSIINAIGGGTTPAKICLEGANIEKTLAPFLHDEGIQVEILSLPKERKGEGLRATSAYVRLGRIRFPKKGAEPLVDNIVWFGSEKHDDLADAFTIGVLKIMQNKVTSTDGGLEYMREEYEKTIRGGPGGSTDLQGWVNLYKKQGEPFD